MLHISGLNAATTTIIHSNILAGLALFGEDPSSGRIGRIFVW